ncbi:hypothetical protein Tco_0086117 [Tanacetum coccineum]
MAKYSRHRAERWRRDVRWFGSFLFSVLVPFFWGVRVHSESLLGVRSEKGKKADQKWLVGGEEEKGNCGGGGCSNLRAGDVMGGAEWWLRGGPLIVRVCGWGSRDRGVSGVGWVGMVMEFPWRVGAAAGACLLGVLACWGEGSRRLVAMGSDGWDHLLIRGRLSRPRKEIAFLVSVSKHEIGTEPSDDDEISAGGIQSHRTRIRRTPATASSPPSPRLLTSPEKLQILLVTQDEDEAERLDWVHGPPALFTTISTHIHLGVLTQIQTLRISSTQDFSIECCSAALTLPSLYHHYLTMLLPIPITVERRGLIFLDEFQLLDCIEMAVLEIGTLDMGEVNTRVVELAELHERDTQDLYALLEDAQDSRSRMSQRVEMNSQWVDLLMGDRTVSGDSMEWWRRRALLPERLGLGSDRT